MGCVTLGSHSKKTWWSDFYNFRRVQATQGPLATCKVRKKSIATVWRILGKCENWGKNSPKIGGGGQVPQFWKLSRPVSPTSPHTKIGPRIILGEEIWGLIVWTLVQISQKFGGPPPQSLIFLESPWGGLQALENLWAKVQKQRSWIFWHIMSHRLIMHWNPLKRVVMVGKTHVAETCFYTYHIETNRLKHNYFRENFYPLTSRLDLAVGASTKATNWRFLEIQLGAKSDRKQLERWHSRTLLANVICVRPPKMVMIGR